MSGRVRSRTVSESETKPGLEPETDTTPDGELEPGEGQELEPGSEPEPGPSPELEPIDDRSVQAKLAELERENTRHAKAFAKAIGVKPEQLHFCPVCDGTGFTPEPVDEQPDYRYAAAVVECPDCNGYGQQRYPSRVPGQGLQVCVSCAGLGWKREQSPDAAPLEPQVAPVAPAANGGPVAPPGYILVPTTVETGPSSPPPVAYPEPAAPVA